MSLESKINDLKRKCFKELYDKENELKKLQTSLDYTLTHARKELLAESDQIENEKRNLEIERVRVNKCIDDKCNGIITLLEELHDYGRAPEIIDAYIDVCFKMDEKLARYFENKTHPAVNTAFEIRSYKKEIKGYLQRIQELEYQLSDFWDKDNFDNKIETFELSDDDEWRLQQFLTKKEYEELSETERNQRALDNYLCHNHTNSHVGKMYERYIGYLYEINGYEVEYRGIEKGLKDGGIDLICKKTGELLLVQCKNWRGESTIYEKPICQLYGASKYYDKEHIYSEYPNGLFNNIDWNIAKPVFVTTAQLDDHAFEVAKALGIEIRNIPFRKDYPIIKCNINNGEKIYHLPIDQMYDQTKICKRGECYVSTVQEAEEKGFRRAHKWSGQIN